MRTAKDAATNLKTMVKSVRSGDTGTLDLQNISNLADEMADTSQPNKEIIMTIKTIMKHKRHTGFLHSP